MSFHPPDRDLRDTPQAGDSPDPVHVAAVLAAAHEAQPRCGSVRIVAIDGLSGSGKTSLAAAVAAALGAKVVSMDHLYPGWDGLAAGIDGLVEHVLAPLCRGEVAAYRIWDWHRDRWGEQVEVPPADVVVVEGCGASVGPAGEYAALRVWLEAPVEQRKARALARDGETFRPHWKRWAAQEAAIFGPDGTPARADLVLTTG